MGLIKLDKTAIFNFAEGGFVRTTNPGAYHEG